MALDANQRRAIEQLAAGNTITDAAKAVGVSRETLSRWVNHDADFAAELDRVNKAITRGTVRRFVALYSAAFDRMEQLVNSNDAAVSSRAAEFILKHGPIANVKHEPETADSESGADPDAMLDRLVELRIKNKRA